MKTIKPLRLGLLHKVYEEKRRFFFVPTIIAFFPFDNPSELISEMDLWKTIAAVMKDTVLDMGMPKLRGEVLVVGTCYPPERARPAPACPVRLKLGAIDKTLDVFGDRHWVRKGGVEVISDPIPFTEMEMSYQNAFGGEGYGQNPVGKGAVPVPSGEASLHPLPNVEDPKGLIVSPKDRPALPAGFGPYDFTWPQRFSKAGTYDKKWLDHLFPGFAEDMDWSIFNAAPEDQWVSGFFEGGEAFSIENMHSEKPVLASHLPTVRTRCFITQKEGDKEGFKEILMRPETVWLFPNIGRGLLLFRGGAEIATDDGEDILQIVIACEDLNDARSVDHYRTVLDQRLDKEKGALFALRDSDLMPASAGNALPAELVQKSPDAPEDLLRKNMRRRAERELQKVREQIKGLGQDPDKFVPPELPPEPAVPNLEELPAFVESMEAMKAKALEEAYAKRAQMEETLKGQLKTIGYDYDQVLAQAKEKGGKRWFSADETIGQLQKAGKQVKEAGALTPELERKLFDPELEKKLRLAEEKSKEAYRKYAHFYDPQPALSSEAAQALRETIVKGRKEGRSFAGADLTGADLSNLDLSGIDFRDAILEGVNLTGTDFTNADLSHAVLAGADLSRAKFQGARLRGTNLGRARMEGADFSGGLDLREAVLSRSDLKKAVFSGANLEEVDFFEAVFNATDMSGVKAPKARFIKTDLSGSRFVGADLSESIMLEAQVKGTDFSGAKLTSAVFVTAKGERCLFKGADLENLRVVANSSLPGSDFEGAKLNRANLRETDLENCSFLQASLDGADLSGCNLKGANLSRASAKGARFEKADLTGAAMVSVNLMEGSLRKALFHNADFRGANLFGVDFEKAKGNRQTDFRGANLKRTRMVDWDEGDLG